MRSRKSLLLNAEVGATWRYPVVLKEIRADSERELGRVVEVAVIQ